MKIRKLNKHLLLGISTFVVLIILVVIQVLFMIKASKIEAKNFNHRVVVALKESRDEIGRRARTCHNMNNFVCGNQCSSQVKSVNFNIVDSIIKSNLWINKIDLEYTFDIDNTDNLEPDINMSCYEQSLNGLLKENGIRLRIQFPDSTKFVYAQMGSLFYISIASILLLMLSFIISYRMYRREKAIVKSASFFIDNMIHEFHTPIANIKFASNLLKKNTRVYEDVKMDKYISLIQNENTKMECHVGDIQNITQINPQQSETLQFNTVLHDCANNFVIPIENANGKLIMDLQDTTDAIKGDTHLIKLVISNLIDNAIKYNNTAPVIELHTYKSGNELVFKVKDNGIGIPKKELDKIFIKYYRVSTGNIHNTKGFGLGLAFVKEVIKKHNASISVCNNSEAGVTFTVKFKLA